VLHSNSGFHQILLKESDIKKTAFSIDNGKYELTRLPFGLKNAQSIFQGVLDDVLHEHIGKICFIDDIIIKREVEFLGFVVSDKGIETSPTNSNT